MNEEVRDFIDDDTEELLLSLTEHGKTPTKLELHRFIESLGYRRLSPEKPEGKREQRNLKKHLKELSSCCTQFLRQLDIVMEEPSNAERGKKIAHLSNFLEMANDQARYFALGVDYRKDKKTDKPTEYVLISPEKLTVLSEKDLEWLDEARSYAAKKFGIDDGYLDLFSYRNMDAWRDYIDDGYTPKDAVEEDLSYAD